MFGCVCKDGIKTKEWTQLQLFDVATRLLLAAMPLLLGGCLCWNTALFFICCEWENQNSIAFGKSTSQ